MVVYIDIVFLENLLLDYLLLDVTSHLLRIKRNYFRFLFAAFIGASYSVFAILYPLPMIRGIVLKLMVAVLMTSYAYRASKDKIILYTISFYLVAFVFGGAAFYAMYNEKTSLLQIYLTIFLCYVLFMQIQRLVKRKMQRENFLCQVFLPIGEEGMLVKALIDTGNTLTDEYGVPVVILQEEKLKKRIPLEEYAIMRGEAKVPEDKKEEYREITFHALGTKSGKIVGKVLKNIVVYYEGKKIEVDRIILGITENKMKEYEALVGLDLMERGYICGDTYFIKTKNKKVIF